MSCTPENLDKNEVSSLEEYENDSTDTEEIPIVNYRFLTEKKIGGEETYILHIAATPDADCNIVIGTSDDVCEIYRLGENQLAKIETFESNDTITGVQTCPNNNNLFYCGSTKSIKLWDIRTPQKFTLEISEGIEDAKPLACFEVSPNNRLLTAGSELHQGEAFMLFWDIRNVRLMGAYWQSHSDTITQVKFSNNDVNTIMSGSVDGLINVFDAKCTNEDDALLDSFNTGSSVEQLLWYERQGKNWISCITHTSDIQLWATGIEPYVHFRRSDITKAMKRKSEAHCYIVSSHSNKLGDVLVLTGAHSKNKEYLSLMNISTKELVYLGNLIENKQRVRCSFYNPNHNLLLTGGELGLLNVWNINPKS
ncbi:hypothetical protein RN001_000154 [Aquatica leii]|uniref:WD repeat-containing protein 89 n=1 Tax=Aquatica leii TaxID=1421715 RepID=A0AAN7PEY3_9COLE|nr:hypothetical protein RN001_000154 [Aquatica leii]